MPTKVSDDTPWSAEAQAVRDFKKTLLLVAGAAVKYQLDGRHNLEDQQEVIMAIADIATDTFVAESQLLRAQRLAVRSNYPAEVPEAITEVILHECQARILQRASEALMGFATGDERTILLKGVRRFSAYPPVDTIGARRTIADHLIAGDGYVFEP